MNERQWGCLPIILISLAMWAVIIAIIKRFLG